MCSGARGLLLGIPIVLDEVGVGLDGSKAADRSAGARRRLRGRRVPVVLDEVRVGLHCVREEGLDLVVRRRGLLLPRLLLGLAPALLLLGLLLRGLLGLVAGPLDGGLAREAFAFLGERRDDVLGRLLVVVRRRG